VIENGLITREEFMEKISAERATYQNFSILHRSESQSYCTEAAKHLGISRVAQT
jgi:hypothetical protein